MDRCGILSTRVGRVAGGAVARLGAARADPGLDQGRAIIAGVQPPETREPRTDRARVVHVAVERGSRIGKFDDGFQGRGSSGDGDHEWFQTAAPLSTGEREIPRQVSNLQAFGVFMVASGSSPSRSDVVARGCRESSLSLYRLSYSPTVAGAWWDSNPRPKDPDVVPTASTCPMERRTHPRRDGPPDTSTLGRHGPCFPGTGTQQQARRTRCSPRGEDRCPAAKGVEANLDVLPITPPPAFTQATGTRTRSLRSII